jgi:hydrogenase maturation factor
MSVMDLALKQISAKHISMVNDFNKLSDFSVDGGLDNLCVQRMLRLLIAEVLLGEWIIIHILTVMQSPR